MDLQKINKKKLRDYLVKGAMILTVAGILYYALSPSPSDEKGKKPAGLNLELPDGKSEPLPQDKMKVYEDVRPEKEGGNIQHLDDYMLSLKTKQGGGGNGEKPGHEYDVEIRDTPADPAGLATLQHTLTAGNDREYDRIAEKNAELESEVYQLKRELEQKKRMEDHIALMEKSYQLAAKYKETPAVERSPVPELPPVAAERETVEVTRKDADVVTALGDELLLDAPYNYGFVTAVGSGYEMGNNTIRAAISQDQTITAGDRVMMRLLEPLQAGNLTIPRNYQIAGVARLQNDRVDILIESIEYAGSIIPVSMKVYDTDGMPGIYCPGSVELDALKEGAATIGSGLGTSISFTHSAGQQAAMDLTRGVMNGASGYLSKKLRTVKVTLKSNYEVLLLPQKNK